MAQELDIDECRFSQADLLRMVPGLSTGTLQNWIARGVIEIEKPAKHAKVYWSARSVMLFRIVIEMVKVGLKPSQAFEVAYSLANEADSFIKRFQRTLTDTGVLEYSLEGDRMGDYRRFRVYPCPGRPEVYSITEFRLEAGADDVERAFTGGYVTIVIEADILFMTALNAVSRLLAGGVDVLTGTPFTAKEGI